MSKSELLKIFTTLIHNTQHFSITLLTSILVASKKPSKTMAQRKADFMKNKENEPVINQAKVPERKIPKKKLTENPAALAGALETMESHRTKRITRSSKKL